MSEKALTALLILGLLLVGPCTSSAPAQEPVMDPEIARDVAAAKAYWHTDLDAVVIREQWCPEPEVWAAAGSGGTVIALDPDWYPEPSGLPPGWWAAAMGSVVAHEYGHLLGLGHSTDPRSIMNPVTPLNVVPGVPWWFQPTSRVTALRVGPRARRARRGVLIPLTLGHRVR